MTCDLAGEGLGEGLTLRWEYYWQGSEEIRRGALPPGLEVPPRMRGLRRVLCWYIVGLCYRAPGQEESKELGIVTSQSLFLYAFHPVLAKYQFNTRSSLSPRQQARLQNSSWPRQDSGGTQVITRQDSGDHQAGGFSLIWTAAPPPPAAAACLNTHRCAIFSYHALIVYFKAAI